MIDNEISIEDVICFWHQWKRVKVWQNGLKWKS